MQFRDAVRDLGSIRSSAQMTHAGDAQAFADLSAHADRTCMRGSSPSTGGLNSEKFSSAAALTRFGPATPHPQRPVSLSTTVACGWKRSGRRDSRSLMLKHLGLSGTTAGGSGWRAEPGAADLQSAPVIERQHREFPNESSHRDPFVPAFWRRVSCPFCSTRSGRLTATARPVLTRWPGRDPMTTRGSSFPQRLPQDME